MKTVVVTGCSKGIGLAIAKKFLAAGDLVIGTYRTDTKDLASLKKDFDSNLKLFSVDLSDLKQVETFAEAVLKDFAPDILVNNAALSQHKPLLELSMAEWSTMFTTNLFSVVRLSQLFLPSMKERKFGRFVNITSIGGQWGGVKQVHYAATKAALINFTQSIAKSFSSFGITANCVSPGSIDTDMLRPELPTDKEKLAAFLRSIPVGRLGKTEEVADTVYFLASKEAAYISGQTVNVNGGVYFG